MARTEEIAVSSESHQKSFSGIHAGKFQEKSTLEEDRKSEEMDSDSIHTSDGLQTFSSVYDLDLRGRSTLQLTSSARDIKEKSLPLFSGDVIYLVSVSTESKYSNKGFFHSEGFSDTRIGLLPREGSDSEPKRFDEALFRVVQKLSYEASKSLTKTRKSGSCTRNMLEYMEEKVEKEKKKNEASIQSFESVGITYGEVIQLQHVNSGKFLSIVPRTLADVEKECMKVKLVSSEEESDGCWFRFAPRFKIRADGGQVFINDQITLQSVKSVGHCIHISSLAYPSASLVNSVSRKEVNLSKTASPFRIHRYEAKMPDENKYLRAGQCVRLMHSEVEGYLNASTNIFKTKVPMLTRFQSGRGATGCSSSKSVFRIEGSKRRVGGVLKWGTTVRFRHVSTGKYLAIDPFDSKLSEARDFQRNMAHSRCQLYSNVLFSPSGDAHFGVVLTDEDSHCSEFVIHPVLVTQDDSRIALSDDLSIRLEHVLQQGIMTVQEEYYQSAWLHNTNISKENFNDTKTTFQHGQVNLHVSMSTRRHDEDAFTLEMVNDSESEDIRFIKSLIEVIEFFVTVLRSTSASKPLRKVEGNNILASLSNLVFFLIDTKDDDPLTCSGIPNKRRQQIARELKLMDALCWILLTPFDMGYTKEDLKTKKNNTLNEIMQLSFRCLTFCFMNNRRNEYYLATTCLSNWLGKNYEFRSEKDGLGAVPYINIIIKSLGSGTGAASALKTLISDNRRLLEEKINEDTVHYFLDLICEQGPEERFLHFLIALCSCDGAAVLSNQENLLKLVLSVESFTKTNEYSRNRLEMMIETTMVSGGPVTSKNTLPFHIPSNITDEHGFSPLSMGIAQGSLPDLRISWHGVKEWKTGMKSLFFSPKALNVPYVVLEKPAELAMYEDSIQEFDSTRQWVSLAEISWTLDPEKYYSMYAEHIKELRTTLGDSLESGVSSELPTLIHSSWSEYKKNVLVAKSESLRNYESKRKIALYYTAMLELFSEMCYDRSYNCIEFFQNLFSYEMVLVGMVHPLYPCKLRCAFSSLMSRLYVDRFPHERLSIPELTRIYDEINVTSSCTIPKFELRDEQLAEMEHHKEQLSRHRNFNDIHGFMSFRTRSKFLMLEKYLVYYFNSLDGKQVILDMQNNRLSKCLLEIAQHLLSFGFFSFDKQHLLSFLTPVIDIVDGRNDTMHHETPDNAPLDEVQNGTSSSRTTTGKSMLKKLGQRMFSTVTDTSEISTDCIQRYDITEESLLVMHTKREICKILAHVLKIKLNDDINSFLATFRGVSADRLVVFCEQSQEEECVEELKRCSQVLEFCWQDTLSVKVVKSRERKRKVQESGAGSSIYYFEPLEGHSATTKSKCDEWNNKFTLATTARTTLSNEGFECINGLFGKKRRAVRKKEVEDSITVEGESNAPIKTICMDLMMYGDEELFAESLNLLVAYCSQRREFRKKLAGMHMLTDEYSVKAYRNIASDLSFLRHHVESYETWGVNNEFSPVDDHIVSKVKGIFAKLTEIVSPNAVNVVSKQNILAKMDVLSIILRLVSIPISAEELAQKTGHLFEIKKAANLFLAEFVRNNRANQLLVFEHIQTLINQMGHGLRVADVVTNLFTENKLLCLKVPSDIIYNFANTIEKRGLQERWINFFRSIIMAGGAPIKRNQELVLRVLTDPQYTKVCATWTEGMEDVLIGSSYEFTPGYQTRLHFMSRYKYYEDNEPSTADEANERDEVCSSVMSHCSLITLLGVISKGKSAVCEVKCQQLLPLRMVLEILLDERTIMCVKEAFLSFLTEVYFETEITRFESLTRNEDVWKVLTNSAQDLDVYTEFTDFNTPQSQSTAHHQQQHQQQQQQSAVHDYSNQLESLVLNGILPSLAGFFKSVYNAETTTAEMDETSKVIQTGVVSLVSKCDKYLNENNENNAHISLEIVQKICAQSVRCATAMGAMKVDANVDSFQLASSNHTASGVLLIDNETYEAHTEPEESTDDPVYDSFKEVLNGVSNSLLLKRQEELEFSELVRAIIDVASLTDKNDVTYKARKLANDANVMADDRANTITFEAIIKRMIGFIRHTLINSVGEEKHASLKSMVMRIFRGILEHYRPPSEEDAETFGLTPFEVEDLEERYKEAQQQLSAYGVSELVLDILSIPPSQEQSNEFIIETIQLGIELLEGGNMVNQRQMYNYLVSHRRGTFFQNMKLRMEQAQAEIKSQRKMLKRREEYTKFESVGNQRQRQRNAQSFSMNDEEGKLMNRREETLRIDLVFRLLQLFTEGHFLDMQNLLREQSSAQGFRFSSNLVFEATAFLSTMVKNEVTLRKLDEKNLRKVLMVLDFLIECMQGPCGLNQQTCGNSMMVSVCKRIMHADLRSNKISEDLKKELKFKGVLCLTSLLEGRNDNLMHLVLVEHLEISLIKKLFIKVYNDHVVFLERKAKAKALGISDSKQLSKNSPHLQLGFMLLSLCESLSEQSVEFRDSISLKTSSAIINEQLSNYDEDDSTSEARRQKEIQAEKDFSQAYSFLNARIGSVEIVWNGHLDRVQFAIPVECQFLTDETRQSILDEIDYTSDEKARDFIEKSAELDDTLSHYAKLNSQPVYRALGRHGSLMKRAGFLVTVLINLILMTSLEYNSSGSVVYRKGQIMSLLVTILGSTLVTLALFILYMLKLRIKTKEK